MADAVITVTKAAERLQLSEGSVRRLFDSGRLRGWRTPGGFRRIDLKSVIELRHELVGSAPRLWDRAPVIDNARVDAGEFECALCGGTFEKAWTDQEAAAEHERLFGEFVVGDPETAVICDDCFRKLGLSEGNA